MSTEPAAAQAQARRSQAIEQVFEAERAVVAQACPAFAVWRSAQEVIASSEGSVADNRESLEGVRAENSVATRTILDVLNAEQELLNAQVTLATARRDAYVAGFALLAAMDRAEPRDLGLDGGGLYDPTVNYRRVNNKVSDVGFDPESEAVATGTTGIRAQDSTVPSLLPAGAAPVNDPPSQ